MFERSILRSSYRPLFRALAVLLQVAGLSFVVAQPAAAQSPFGGGGAKAEASAAAREEGGEVQVAIEIDIQPHWHLYHFHKGNPDGVGLEMKVRFKSEGIQFGEVRAPEPEVLEQPGVGPGGSDVWIYGHEGTIVLHSIGKLEGGTSFSAEAIEISISGLTCEDGGECIPFRETITAQPVSASNEALFAAFPSDLSLEFEGPAPLAADQQVSGSAAGSTAAASHSAGPHPRDLDVDYGAWTPPPFEIQESESKSIWMYLLLAFVAGAILNVMPCVLPVISIKVLSFVNQAGESKARVFQLGLAFAAGIVVVFWGLAIFAITAGAGWGQQFQSTTFLIVMIGLVFAFAMSMFGVFEIGVPSQVGQMASGNREGLGDAFFKGMLATALATPCSGPFLGSTLVWALAQSNMTIFAIFTALGLGMALPYVFLTANPKLLKKLPKPGAWMETFKQAMGFVLVATVLFLMRSLDTDYLMFTLLFLVFVALGCWWYGRFATWDKPAGVRLRHLAAGLAMAGAGAWLSFGVAPNTGSKGSVDWVHFTPDGFEQALASGRNVFVDFTADWCVNCKTNKTFVYESDVVAALFREKNVLVLEADETDGSEYTSMLEGLRSKLGSKSIPFMAIFSADDPYKPVVAHSIVGRGQMVEMLEALPDTGAPKETEEVSSAAE